MDDSHYFPMLSPRATSPISPVPFHYHSLDEDRDSLDFLWKSDQLTFAPAQIEEENADLPVDDNDDSFSLGSFVSDIGSLSSTNKDEDSTDALQPIDLIDPMLKQVEEKEEIKKNYSQLPLKRKCRKIPKQLSPVARVENLCNKKQKTGKVVVMEPVKMHTVYYVVDAKKKVLFDIRLLLFSKNQSEKVVLAAATDIGSVVESKGNVARLIGHFAMPMEKQRHYLVGRNKCRKIQVAFLLTLEGVERFCTLTKMQMEQHQHYRNWIHTHIVPWFTEYSRWKCVPELRQLDESHVDWTK